MLMLRPRFLNKTDDFNEAEEKEVKEHAGKRKMKRREVAEKNTLLKKKEQEKNKEDEKEMWIRLKELNKELKDVSEHKKKQ